MKKQTEKVRRVTGTALLLLLALASTPALAVETDRVTVEDPSTGIVMFRVTSAGNVTGATFNGDGSGLTNVPHWKGTWSAATTYSKDDCVSSGGSSWIALQPSSNAQPSLNPASWAVLAQQGPAGATGVQGTAGAAGPTGPQGPQGLPGSPDTQEQILSKLATATAGAVLTVQQAPGELNTAPKLIIKDSSNIEKLTFSLDGALNLIGSTNQKMFTDNPNTRSVFATFRARGSAVTPVAVQLNDKVGTFQFSSYDGAAFQTAALLEGFVDGNVSAGSVPTRLSVVTGTSMANRSERLVVKSTGNVGIGTTSPTQKLEVNGGVRINTATAKPGCDSAARGTFWLTQKQAGEMDALEVCIKDATEAYVWKAVW
ncbi:MAG: hypothetical protein A2075_06405 [Geobacteraceae bacterium GWC2_58_44]|nr:MAG: hypothetical protein A2075_06405 [Geobacteraceae bacterium GWC2_58_44]